MSDVLYWAPSIPSINYKPSADCAYTMLVSKIKDKKTVAPLISFSLQEEAAGEEGDTESRLERLRSTLGSFKHKTDDDGSQSDSSSTSMRSSESHVTDTNNQKDEVLEKQFEIPPSDVQIIIDKMASYVAKNGRDFETIVKSKGDPRFNFLIPTHEHHSYYQHKVTQYENIDKVAIEAKVEEGKKTVVEQAESKVMESKTKDEKPKVTPVCFSIKKPKESEPVIERSALPVEESSDEENAERKENKKEEKQNNKEAVEIVDLAAMEDKEEKCEKIKKILAAERLKDKLTAAAREKIAQVSKEKQVQLERKRKVAAFLRTVKPDSTIQLFGPQLPGQQVERIDDNDSDVVSLPDESEDEVVTKKVKIDAKKSKETENNSEEVLDKRKHEEGKKHKKEEKHRTCRRKEEKRKSSREKHKKEKKRRKSVSPECGKKRKKDKYEEEEKRVIRIVDDSDSSSSGGEEVRKVYFAKNGYKKGERRKEERRHKHKKHRKEKTPEKSSRRHTKSNRSESELSNYSDYKRSKRKRSTSSVAAESYSSDS